jgi:hypothetical protein
MKVLSLFADVMHICHDHVQILETGGDESEKSGDAVFVAGGYGWISDVWTHLSIPKPIFSDLFL